MTYWDEGTGRCASPPHIAWQLVTPPTLEPFTLAEAKGHLRIVTDDENTDVVRWVQSARAQVERETGIALLTQTWDLFLDACPSRGWVTIPKWPVQSVTSVTATDSSGVGTVWSASNYVVDTASRPPRIGLVDGGNWPTGLRGFQPVKIRLVAGWTSAELIPADLRAAVGLLIGWFDQNRQPNVFERSYYDSLIAPYTLHSAA